MNFHFKLTFILRDILPIDLRKKIILCWNLEQWKNDNSFKILLSKAFCYMLAKLVIPTI